MLPGPTYIIECHLCGHYLARPSWLSGNTYDMKLYSDGKQIAPMLPEICEITVCPECSEFVWLDKANIIGMHDYGKDTKEEWRKASPVKFLSLYEYHCAIDKKVFENDTEEMYLRKGLWWAFNDRVREGAELFANEKEKAIWGENAIQMLKKVNSDEVNLMIVKAELLRNMGEFDKCKEIISLLDLEQFGWLKVQFIAKCDLEDKLVFQLKFD